MARPTRLTIAKKDIFAVFDQATQKVYSQQQLAGLLSEHRSYWRLAERTTASEFIAFLQKQGVLKAATFRSDLYHREITRYSWGDTSIYELAQSLRARGYLSHSTAVALHGLTDLIPKTLYANVEQSPKPTSPSSLTQRGLDSAFARKQRRSNMTFAYDDWSVTIVNGKNTGELGVEEIAGPSSELLRVTNLERTLIDIVVRPDYSGGIFHILEAYRGARDQVSTNRLVATLKKLDYVYPYHQAIGFLMQRAGYNSARYSMLRELGSEFDFYLTHDMKNPRYLAEWRLFIPEGI